MNTDRDANAKQSVFSFFLFAKKKKTATRKPVAAQEESVSQPGIQMDSKWIPFGSLEEKRRNKKR